MARALAKAGTSVVISSRHEDELQAAATEIRQDTRPKRRRSPPTDIPRGSERAGRGRWGARQGRYPDQQCRKEHATADRSDHRRSLGSHRRAEFVVLHGGNADLGSPDERPALGSRHSHFVNHGLIRSKSVTCSRQPKARSRVWPGRALWTWATSASRSIASPRTLLNRAATNGISREEARRNLPTGRHWAAGPTSWSWPGRYSCWPVRRAAISPASVWSSTAARSSRRCEPVSVGRRFVGHAYDWCDQ